VSVEEVAIYLPRVKILGSIGYGLLVISIILFTILNEKPALALVCSGPIIFTGLIIAGITWRALGKYMRFRALRICGLVLLTVPFLAITTYSIILYYMLFVRLREIQMKYAALALNIATAIYPTIIALLTAISVIYVMRLVETYLAKISTAALFIALFLHLIALLPGLVPIHMVALWISAVGYISLSLNFIKLPSRLIIVTTRG